MAGKPAPWGWAAAGLAVLLGVAVWLAPAPSTSAAPTVAAETPQQLTAKAQAIIGQRCVMCHNAQIANKGVRLDSPEAIATRAQAIYQQVVALRAMPLNNATQITEDERATLGRWYQATSAAVPTP